MYSSVRFQGVTLYSSFKNVILLAGKLKLPTRNWQTCGIKIFKCKQRKCFHDSSRILTLPLLFYLIIIHKIRNSQSKVASSLPVFKSNKYLILSKRFWSNQWAAAPLQRVANQWVTLGVDSIQTSLKTIFLPSNSNGMSSLPFSSELAISSITILNSAPYILCNITTPRKF